MTKPKTTTASRVCSEPGCRRLVTTTRCDEHRLPEHRPHSRARGYGEQWRRVRARFLVEYPRCQYTVHYGTDYGVVHGPTCGMPATDVHHRDGLGPTGPKGYDFANLMALCHSHHSQITASWARRTA